MITEQQQSLINQLRQVFLTLVDQQANNDDFDGDTQHQAAVVLVRSVLERMSIACAREAAVREKVRQLDDDEGKGGNKPEPGAGRDATQWQEEMYFLSLLSVDDQCEPAILELFQVAAIWKEVGDNLLEGTSIDMSALQFACLQQRRRVMRLALRVMDRQIATERKRLRFNGTAATATGGKIPPGQATGGAAARGAGR